ncbi:MAG: S1 RNA-binding domain-containing protein [Lachnospiraceae bacterium]|nr:S1 RNA-binding domain-containing protein [Lachnospiraceae bacterium]
MSEEITNTTTESMDDYKDELDRSFRSIKEGDVIKGTIIDISEDGITLDIGYFTDGFIATEEISNDPTFSAMDTYQIGETIEAAVLSAENSNGSIELSIKETAQMFSWDKLKEGMDKETVYSVKIADAVPSAGLIAYIENIRGFIPISQISTEHIEDTVPFVNKTMDVVITSVEPSNNKLILSAKKVALQRAAEEKVAKVSSLQKGLITTGVVEKIAPYGAFIRIEDDLSGLCHISEICGRRLKSPKEVLHEGDKVNVKIINVTDGKVSLSIKQADATFGEEEVVEHISDVPTEYSSNEEASTSLGSLFANIKLN